MDAGELDPGRFETHWYEGRGFRQAYVHEGVGGSPLLLVHGWPETKRIWWRVIDPLVAAGFEVIAPDLRNFGESDVAPDGFGDVASSSRDLHALVRDHLGHGSAALVGGDFGGPIVQDMALRFGSFVDRMVLFNSPLPYDEVRMAGMRTRPQSAHDYFLRQGTDPDGLAAELTTADQRRRYIATFYSSRFWAHPGAFDDAAIAFHTEPFGDGAKLRASWGAYESAFSESARVEPAIIGPNPDTRTLILFGPSDHVIYPDFDLMAAVVFDDHVGPFLLRDCGHFVQWESAHALSSAVTAFAGDLLGAQRRV
ncbi:MAG TPA: alpha/beta hydrolase [Acidimicrobiales bacterium]|nr:alpha/beta hydrolase [Acidimicrobiales bacterium]